jgi:hypothetical protein
VKLFGLWVIDDAILILILSGIFVCIFRMVILFQTGATDSTWNAIKFGSLTCAEGSTYLMAACLPLYRPFVQAFGRRVGTTFASRAGKTYGSKLSGNSFSRGTNKDDDLELAAIKSPAFNGLGFERLDEDNGKTRITTEQRSVDSQSTEDLSRGKRTESGIQVKKEFSIENNWS